MLAGVNTYVYVQNNPVRLDDPLGLASLRLSFFRGVGGIVTLGIEGGKPFVIADAGFGLGASITFDPTGGFPRPEGELVPAGREGFIGFAGQAGVIVGPFGVGGLGFAGINFVQKPSGEPCARFTEGSEPFGSVRIGMTTGKGGRIGLGAILSGTARVGFTF